MKIQSTAPVAKTANARVSEGFDALKEAPASVGISADTLRLSKPVAPRLDQVPEIKGVKGFFAKAAVAGTILGSMALLTASAWSIAAGMGPAMPLVMGMAMLGNAALGLLGWGLLKK